MGYEVLLRRNKTGEQQAVMMDGAWDDLEKYLWTDGNWACDCNRHELFCRAAGQEVRAVPPCGESEYSALRVSWEGRNYAVDSPEAA